MNEVFVGSSLVCMFTGSAQTWGVDWFCPGGTFYEFPLVKCNYGWFQCQCGGSTATVPVYCYAYGGVAFCGYPDRAFIWDGFPTCPTDLSRCSGCNDGTVLDDASSITCSDCIPGYENPGSRCPDGKFLTSNAHYL